MSEHNSRESRNIIASRFEEYAFPFEFSDYCPITQPSYSSLLIAATLDKTKSEVAIKLADINPHYIREGPYDREVEMLRSLKHPHIVPVYFALKKGPQKIIIMEYAPKGTLEHLVTEEHPSLPLQYVCSIARQLGMALHFMHCLVKIAHLNLHPGHVLIRHPFHLMLTDFKSATPFKDPKALQHHSSMPSKRDYTAPETLDEEKIGMPSDIYAYGKILLCLSTGWSQYPYPGEHTDEDFTYRHVDIEDHLYGPELFRRLRIPPQWRTLFLNTVFKICPTERWLIQDCLVHLYTKLKV